MKGANITKIQQHIFAINKITMTKAISDKLISGAIQIVPFSDKILYDDSVGDDIPNKDDPYLYKAYDDKFMIADVFNYILIGNDSIGY